MGLLFSCCKNNKDENIDNMDNEKTSITPNLTDQEKENIANKRLQYLENKYPPQKPLNKTKSIDIPVKDEKKHEQYIRDWRD